MEGIFDLMYAVTYLSRFYAYPTERHLELAKKVFGYLKEYPKQGYGINPQPLTIYMEYKKVNMNMYFGNKYSYLQEDIDEKFPEPLFH